MAQALVGDGSRLQQAALVFRYFQLQDPQICKARHAGNTHVRHRVLIAELEPVPSNEEHYQISVLLKQRTKPA